MTTDTLKISDLESIEDTGVLIVSAEGRIQYANAAFRDEFDWPAGSLDGAPMIRIVPASHRDAHNLAFARFLTRGTGTILGQPLMLPIVTGGGKTRTAEVCIFAERQPGGEWLFGATIQAC